MSTTSLSRKNFWVIALNSLSAYVLSYLFLFYLTQFSYLLTAGMYSFPITIDYAGFFFHIEPYQWSHDAVFLIFSSGYVLSLLFGLLAVLAFFYTIADSMPIKVFFMWTIIHASNYFFGGLMLGNLLTQGVGHVFNWMYLPDTPRMIISLTGFSGLLLTALWFARLVSVSANSYFDKYNEKIAPFFITAQVFVPYFLGSILLFFYFFPKNMFHEKYGWIIAGVMLIIFFHRSKYMEDLLFEEDDQRSFRLMKGFILFTLSFYVLSRVVMHKGFYFDWL